MNTTPLVLEVRAKVGDNDFHTLGFSSTPICSSDIPMTMELKTPIRDALEALLRALDEAENDDE